LTLLPELLPDSLQTLHVAHNQLTSLPERLPTALQMLDASDNGLTGLREHLLTSLGPTCRVVLETNPLSERVRNNLGLIANDADYAGPRIVFSMADAPEIRPVRPVADAVADWYGEDRSAAVRQTWRAFADEEGMAELSRFLDYLPRTVNYRLPQFREHIAEWLSRLSADQDLRAKTCRVSFEASTQCEDRVTHTFNQMDILRIASDVDRGQYDDRLPELIGLARSTFRLRELETIARDKIKALRLVDEIEVYLAYQVKLQERLELRLHTPDMRYFGASGVDEEDLRQAEQRVKEAEGSHFEHFLSSQWEPWRSVMQRLDPERLQQADARLARAIAEEFPRRLREILPSGLVGDADAERNAGPQITAAIAHEIFGQATREFLASQGCSDLLDSPWQKHRPG
jgi:hypothetical protein